MTSTSQKPAPWPILDGIPVYINPLVGESTIVRFLKDTPQEYIIADSMETVAELIRKGNER